MLHSETSFSIVSRMSDADELERPVPITVDLSPRARTAISKFKESFGVTQKAGVERALEFLTTLPEPVLQEVFRRGGDAIGRLIELRLAEQAGVAADATSIDQAAAIIRAQAERLATLARAYRRELDDLHRGGQAVEKVARGSGKKRQGDKGTG